MKPLAIFKLVAFLVVFVGAVIFYVYYGGLPLVDSVFFVVFTISTVGYHYDAADTYVARVFTTFFMIIGVLFVFTYVRNAIHEFGRSVRSCLPSVKQRQSPIALTVASCLLLVVVILLGTLFVALNESYDFATSLYFVVYTATTVGYGDVNIKYASTKVFLIFYVLISPIILAFAFDAILSLPRKLRQRQYAHAVLCDEIPLSDVVVDLNAAQKHTKAELLGRHNSPFLTRMRSIRAFSQHFSDPLLAGQTLETIGEQPASSAQNGGCISAAVDAEEGGAARSPLQEPTAHQDSTHELPSSLELGCRENESALDDSAAIFTGQPERDPGERLPLELPLEGVHTSTSAAGARLPMSSLPLAGQGGPDGQQAGVEEVTKAEYMLSVLLRLGKIDYEGDLFLWAQKFDAMDTQGLGRIYLPAAPDL